MFVPTTFTQLQTAIFARSVNFKSFLFFLSRGRSTMCLLVSPTHLIGKLEMGVFILFSSTMAFSVPLC